MAVPAKKAIYQPELSKVIKNSTFNKIISIESAGRPKAKAPTSSAGGLFQFLNGTFYGVAQIHQPDLLRGRTKAQVYALRFDPEIAIELGIKFTEDNAKALGKGWTEGDLYLAHFLGVGTAKKLLRSSGSTPVSEVVTAAAIKANKTILTNKSCAQVRKWAQVSMDTRWAKLGNPDWIGIWYHKDDHLPVPDIEVIRKNSQPLGHKVEDDDGHLADLDGNGIPDYLERLPPQLPNAKFPQDDQEPAPAPDAPDDEEEPAAPPETRAPRRPSAVVVAGQQTMVQGDANVWLVQNVLKSMNYNPGKADGKWGGMTAEALAGFINDRGCEMTAPTSRAQWAAVEEEMLTELAEAQDESFVRPVSEERANADDKKVVEVAPEAAPAKRGFLVTVFGAIGSFFAAAWNSLSGFFSQAWDFFTDNEDKIPDTVKDPNVVWKFITDLPVGVWFGLIGAILAFVALGNWDVLSKIRQDVKTGMRK